MTQNNTIGDFIASILDEKDSTEDQILQLFKLLPLDRQEAVLEELTQIWDLDEEDDDGSDNPPQVWGAAPIGEG